MKKEKLLENWQLARQDLLRAVKSLSEGELTDEIVRKEWTVKDILGHISSWNQKLTKVISKGLKEGNPQFDYYPISEEKLDEWNRKEVEKKRGLSVKSIREEFEQEERKITKLIRDLSEDDLNREFSAPWGGKTTPFECIQIAIDHVEDHTDTIRAWCT